MGGARIPAAFDVIAIQALPSTRRVAGNSPDFRVAKNPFITRQARHERVFY
jgi:hypothetical protein